MTFLSTEHLDLVTTDGGGAYLALRLGTHHTRVKSHGSKGYGAPKRAISNKSRVSVGWVGCTGHFKPTPLYTVDYVG